MPLPSRYGPPTHAPKPGLVVSTCTVRLAEPETLPARSFTVALFVCDPDVE
jgi:hypothetical protein